MGISVFAAFLAGFISFLSPCVLPLVPGYMSMLSGLGVEQLKEGKSGLGAVFFPAVAFVIGLSAVFITLGASASAVGSFLLQHRNALAPIAGAFILLLGLHLVGWLAKISMRAGLITGTVLVAAGVVVRLAFGAEDTPFRPIYLYSVAVIFLAGPFFARWLNRDVHFRNVGGHRGMLSGFLMGFAFAFGWSPCLGPIITPVLLMAGTRGTIGQGLFLLACYSAGLAIPFLITALAINAFLRFYQRFRRHVHVVEVLSGVLLLAVGGLVFFNRLTWLSGKLVFLNRFIR